MRKKGEAFWNKLSFWAIVAVVIITAVIIYGLWLPTSIEL